MKRFTKWLSTAVAAVLMVTSLLPVTVTSTAQAAGYEDEIQPSEYAPDSILVKLQEGVDAEKFASEHNLEVEKKIGDWLVMQTPMNAAYDYYKELQEVQDAAFVELNLTTKKVATTVSKKSLTDFCLKGECDEIYKPKIPWYEWIQARKAHEITIGAKERVIAMIGTGADIKHPYLEEKIVSPYNFVDQNEEPLDEDGLGTMEAGIAAGAYPDDTSMVALDKAARIMPLKVLNQEGVGKLSDVGEALVYAREKGASVAHLSLDLKYQSQFLYDMINNEHWDRKIIIIIVIVIVVVPKPVPPRPPCEVCGGIIHEVRNLINVLPLRNDLTRFEGVEYGKWADFGVPAENYFAPFADGQFALASGASLASAAVAGAATLTWSMQPEASAEDILTQLQKTANPIEGTGEWFSYGMPDAYKAVIEF